MPESPLAPQPVDLATLANLRIFRGLSDAELAIVQRTLRPRTLAAGEALIHADEPGDAAYIIDRGFIRVESVRPDGEQVILAILGPGELVGEISMVDREVRSANVIAHERTTVYAINRGVFQTLFEKLPRMHANLSRILARRLRLANAQIMALGTMTVDDRIMFQLVTFAREYGEPVEDGAVRIPFRLTQTEIGALVGASRVRVNQVLGEYRRRGQVAIDDRFRITLSDPDSLATALHSGS